MATLVTGGFGFIGQEVVSQLAQRGDQVIAFGRNVNKQSLYENVHHYRGDISSASDIQNLFEIHPIDKVVHLAYAMDIWGDNPKQTVNINVSGFINLMEACIKYSVKRLVWSSSVMVYGRPYEYTGKVNEKAVINPNTFYGKCKQFDEYLAKHYSEKFGLDTICLRPTTVYGPGRYARGAAAFLYDCVYAAVTNQETELTLGHSRTDLVHVRDVAKAFVLAIDAKKTTGSTYNISGFELDAQGLLEIIGRIKNKPAPVTLLPNEDNHFPSKIDRTLAKKELGYEPSITLEQGLEEYIREFDPNVALSR